MRGCLLNFQHGIWYTACSWLIFIEWRNETVDVTVLQGLPWWLSGKESVCQAGDKGSISGLGRSPGGGNGNSLQYPCLENPRDREAWWVTVHGVTELDVSEHLHYLGHTWPFGWVANSWQNFRIFYRILGWHLLNWDTVLSRLIFLPFLGGHHSLMMIQDLGWYPPFIT